LDAKAPTSTPVFTGINTNQKFAEQISYSTNYTFSSNTLTYSYSNNAICYFNSLTSSTNFAIAITNMNPTSATYTVFTVSFIVDCTSYQAYGSTCTINGTSYTLNCAGGLANVNISSVTSSGSVMQVISVVYTSSASVPYQLITNIIAFY